MEAIRTLPFSTPTPSGEQYPPKIAEDMIKPVNPSGGIVLSRVVVPRTIVVHDGAPADSTARDYYVPYKDYIKNVACNEIYSTWPDAAIRANVLAIQSFTLNRVYTEWYGEKDTTLLSRAILRSTRSRYTMQPYLKMSPRSSMRCSPTISQSPTLHSHCSPNTATADMSILSWLDDTVGVKIPGRRRSYRHPDSQILLQGIQYTSTPRRLYPVYLLLIRATS